MTVEVVEDPPIADAGGSYQTVEGQGVDVDGSASRDADDPPGGNSIVRYEWDFNYNAAVGFSSDLESSTPTARGRWIEELARRAAIIDDGSYVVALVVTDSTGRSSPPDTVTFEVDNAPPTVSISGGHVVAIGHDYFVTFNSTDPGDDTVSHVFVDWGDGSPIERAAVTGGSRDPNTGVTSRTMVIAHQFDSKGSHTVGFRAVDEDSGPDLDGDGIPDDAYATNTLTVTVHENPLWVTPAAVSLPENSNDGVGLSATDDRTAEADLTFEITGGADQDQFALRQSEELLPRLRSSSVPLR